MEADDEEIAGVHRQTTLDQVGSDTQLRVDGLEKGRRPGVRERALVCGVVAALVQGAAVVEDVLEQVGLRHAGEKRLRARELAEASADRLRPTVVEAGVGLGFTAIVREVAGPKAEMALNQLGSSGSSGTALC